MLHTETVDASTLDLIHKLMDDKDLKSFNLVGGTALSLLLGHRKSVDIDLFTTEPFPETTLANLLAGKYKAEIVNTSINTVRCFIDDVKVELMAHRYISLQPTIVLEKIRMSSLEDIAAMKLNAIVGNGTRKKDYIDMYVLLEQDSLSKWLQCYVTKYPDTSITMARNSLVYFEDIDHSEEVELLRDNIPWNYVEARLREANIRPDKVFTPSVINSQNYC